MVTFAFAEILVVVADNGGSLTGGPVGMFGVTLGVSTPELFVIVAAAALLISQVERRGLGRALRVISIDEQLARTIGIEINRQRQMEAVRCRQPHLHRELRRHSPQPQAHSRPGVGGSA